MYATPPPARWSSLDARSLKSARDSQDQVERLVALGLIDDDEPRAKSSKKKRDHTSFEIGTQQSQRLHSPKAEVSNFTTNLYNTSFSDREPGFRRTNRSQLSSLAELRERRNSMFASKTRESRRERTFIGSQCASCEEPLEHTLRGERILQLSCGHVSHEACFYEYIKEFEAHECPTCGAPLGIDTSRGGGIDFANLNRLVKSAQAPDFSERIRDQQTTPAPWDFDKAARVLNGSSKTSQTRDHLLPQQTQVENDHPNGQRSQHARKKSGDTATISTNDYAETHHTRGRRNDSDATVIPPSSNGSLPTRITVPSPKITVRSEFPTLSKSRQQQSLTCLVTVEVMDKQLPSDMERFPSPPSLPSIPQKPNERFEPPQESQTDSNAKSKIDSVHEDVAGLEDAKENLFKRCENWHGLDFQRFGDLLLHDTMRVSKDRQAWQDLECYLFSEMLICVKPRRASSNTRLQSKSPREQNQGPRVTLKGSILIKKHLNQIELIPDTEILTLNLSVPELPHFYLEFRDRSQLKTWRHRLTTLDDTQISEPQAAYTEQDNSEAGDVNSSRNGMDASSVESSLRGGFQSYSTAPTEYTNSYAVHSNLPLYNSTVHVPLDVVVVIPVSSSMQGLKIDVLRDSLRFLVSNLGAKDRMGLVTFGSGGGGVPLVEMTSKTWPEWPQVIDSIRPVGQKNMRADVVEGANVAMDLLMQRKDPNSLSHIILVSDSATGNNESVDFVVSRAEAAKVSIHSFGLGLTHKPDTLVELSSKTKASYVYVKDWMMLRECLAGCLGALQSTSHQNVKLKLRVPTSSPAKLVKISGASQVTKRATGRDAEVSLGDLRFGDKRDILVQLAVIPDATTPESAPPDPWDNIISGLEALGGPVDQEEARDLSIEEMPLLQADLSWNDILRNSHCSHLPRPSLLAITMLPPPRKKKMHTPPSTPPIPPHPAVVQRRMELLTSDMLSRALFLVFKGQAERAHHVLAETRTIMKGLNKGSLPPLPPPPTPITNAREVTSPMEAAIPLPEDDKRTPSPRRNSPLNPFGANSGIDIATVAALDSELASSLEWISHPAVFVRDSRKAVLQAINVISSQRAYTFRTPTESLWAGRVSGIKALTERSRDWRETGHEFLMEE